MSIDRIRTFIYSLHEYQTMYMYTLHNNLKTMFIVLFDMYMYTYVEYGLIDFLPYSICYY